MAEKVDSKASIHAPGFDLDHVIHELKHFLPAQTALKDFIHHNTLHAFQDKMFHEGCQQAAWTFGYKVYMGMEEYANRWKRGEIHPEVLGRVLEERSGRGDGLPSMDELLRFEPISFPEPSVGGLRRLWTKQYITDLDLAVHPLLFRLLVSYLDQGISLWDFPVQSDGFLGAVRALERNAFSSFFHCKRASILLKSGTVTIPDLLKLLVGPDETLWARYIWDQQFAHQGWSGLVSAIEDQPQALLDQKPISLHDLILIELLLEIDALDYELGSKWLPLGHFVAKEIGEQHSVRKPADDRLDRLSILQDAFEWSYYDQVLANLQAEHGPTPSRPSRPAGFQAILCIDDRNCSLRRYLEHEAPGCETFGTPGFFGVEFYFMPSGGKFMTKLCPAPVTPKYLIKETGGGQRLKRDLHLNKSTHRLALGWLVTQTMGFWSAMRLAMSIFRPSMGPASTNSFEHHDKVAGLTVENRDPSHVENGLQVGFTVQEMADRVEGMLRSIGLVKDFAPLVYVIGHGASSVNNPHYAAYDCGACSGRPGSVNARVFCHMANHSQVRALLTLKGIHIPQGTAFVGGLDDTTRDEIEFYDEEALSPQLLRMHQEHQAIFQRALASNARERSRRLELVNSHEPAEKVLGRMRLRSVSLFEPRPELNHATNALCIVGRRELSRHLFLDRRSFLNSYDYRTDPEGKYLLGILRAVAPVCGGINLEYYFSRVDNQKLGAGSKLPHNVMGLFGVANGTDGDLRPGLPSQMVEVHDPVRLLVVVEHDPSVVLDTILSHPPTYEWFLNEWVHLVVLNPGDKRIFRFRGGEFHPYSTLQSPSPSPRDWHGLIESTAENLPVFPI